MIRTVLILVVFMMVSCKATDSSQGDYAQFADKELVRLLQIDTTANQFIYENSNALIFIPLSVLQSYIAENLSDKNLCQEKKNDLSKLNKQIRTIEGDANLFNIEHLPAPDYHKDMGRRYYKEYKKQFIEPYGYAPLTKISEPNVKASESYRWIVSDLLLLGKASVFNKAERKFEENILYENVILEDGLGVESLLFKEGRQFFLVKAESHIAWPDFDCLDSLEMRNYGSK
ncbi:hypothetical protein ACSX1A_04390 [Pontibacter sp. MBLB2868]|uniref:hypothetical protein n=1 Tax=Pontibacter sp. MBLB2868 TaxID=3451555 RepID=UPI003F7554B9